jgi:hypothetical protein
MIDPHDFARKQLELTAEFGKFLFDHSELEDNIPNGAYVYFEVSGETDFNRFSRELAERRKREEGVPVILVRVKGLAPPQGSRLIDPVLEPLPTSSHSVS